MDPSSVTFDQFLDVIRNCRSPEADLRKQSTAFRTNFSQASPDLYFKYLLNIFNIAQTDIDV